MTDLQARVLRKAPIGTWFKVSELGLSVSFGALGAAVRHMALDGLLDNRWALRAPHSTSKLWSYRLNARGRKLKKQLKDAS